MGKLRQGIREKNRGRMRSTRGGRGRGIRKKGLGSKIGVE